MAWASEPCCSACSTVWPEVIASNRDHRVVYCCDCQMFVTLERIRYTFRFAVCPGCGSDLTNQPTADQPKTKCPRCNAGHVAFSDRVHLLLMDELPPLSRGMIVDATLDRWAIHVPDLAAIPIANLSGLVGQPEPETYLLEVTNVPTNNINARDYTFRICSSG